MGFDQKRNNPNELFLFVDAFAVCYARLLRNHLNQIYKIMMQLQPEWTPQRAVQLTWPHKNCYWVDYLEDIEAFFTRLATAILSYEPAIIIAYDQAHTKHIEDLLGQGHKHQYRCYIARSNDLWTRDHGPITLIDSNSNLGEPATLLDFNFNSWGGKYEHDLDNLLTRQLVEQQAYGSNIGHKLVNFALEGGALETNGQGTLMTTKSCLLNPNRGNSTDQTFVENFLREHLKVEHIIWIENSKLIGDDTDGHIDMLARFCAPDLITYTSCDDISNANYANMQKLAEELAALRQPTNGEPYRLLPLPLPKPIFNDEGRQLPASYANFLIINGAVLVPIYQDPQDLFAIQQLKAAFPGRDVIGIDSRIAITWGGSLHCMTMQIPE